MPIPSPTPLSPEAEIARQFIAEREKIPVDKLDVVGEESITFRLLGQTYRYITIFAIDSERTQIFSLLVDPITKKIEPDYNAIRDAERAAHHERYGKLEPALHDRLQKIGDEASILVAIWLAHVENERSAEDIIDAVIVRYPAAAKAWEEFGVLWAVDDPDLSTAIQVEYERLRAENIDLRTPSLLEWLRSEGFTAESIDGMPVIHAELPKRIILALNEREDVARIYAFDSEVRPASDIATQSDRAPAVWARGYQGNGIRVAILEAGNITGAAANCVNIVATRAGTSSANTHKNQVAAIAACNNATKPGIAAGVDIVDAGHDTTENDIVNALTWATNPSSQTTAYVVNQSEEVLSFDTDLHLVDHAYDYWVRERRFTAVIAAGNYNLILNPHYNVTTPARAYNVIAVGNVDDKNSALWADDEMYSSSSYVNPSTGVQKPEVAAPGTFIDTVAGEAEEGTSFAAPQVAGLAAILMQRHASLKFYPTAVKSIIMASAVHNIEGNPVSSDKDGAGSIDASLADWVAQTQGTTSACRQPCWWNITTFNTVPAVGNTVERNFKAARGEKIRVVISWLSDPDAPTETSLDPLRRNFDLEIQNPDNLTTAASSVSMTNNYEIVEFTATQTGQYKIRVTRSSSGDGGNESNTNYLGIAWVKDATYLSDIRGNQNGTSNIYLRSESATDDRWTRITFFNQNGSYKSQQSYFIDSNHIKKISPPNNWSGAATINGGEDLTVMVEQVKTSPEDRVSAYTGMRMVGDPGWERPSPTLYLPYVYKGYYNYTTGIHIFNPGPTNVNATVTAYNTAGSSAGTVVTGLNAGVSAIINPPTSNNFFGSAKITSSSSTQPLVVVANHENGNIDISTMAATGASPGYLPYIFKNYYGWDSCFVARNTATITNSVLLAYYWGGGTSWTESTSINNSAMLTKCQSTNGNLPDNNNTLAGRVGSTNIPSKPLTIAINQSNYGQGKHMSYNATSLSSKLVVLPNLRRFDTVNGLTWTSGFQVQSTAASTACVKITLYNKNASTTYVVPPPSGTCHSIPSGTSKGFYMGSLSINNGLWSAIFSSDQPIAVVGNATCTSGCTGDTVYAYNAINR